MKEFTRKDFVEWGRKGGLATSESVPPEKKRECARKAAFARWEKAKQKEQKP